MHHPARWDFDYKDPWLIVTDLEPEVGNVLWYGFRSWIESSYRDVKSDGWQWHKTRLRDQARAERIWLGMAVATLWTITPGSEQPESASEMDIGSEKLNVNITQPENYEKYFGFFARNNQYSRRFTLWQEDQIK